MLCSKPHVLWLLDVLCHRLCGVRGPREKTGVDQPHHTRTARYNRPGLLPSVVQPGLHGDTRASMVSCNSSPRLVPNGLPAAVPCPLTCALSLCTGRTPTSYPTC